MDQENAKVKKNPLNNGLLEVPSTYRDLQLDNVEKIHVYCSKTTK